MIIGGGMAYTFLKAPSSPEMERDEPSTAKSELLRGHQLWKASDAIKDETLLH